jgi:hypothetical protein
MKLIFILFTLIVTSCSGTTSKSELLSPTNKSDIFEKLISLMSNPSVSNLKNYFGEPSKIDEKIKSRFIYNATNDHSKIEVIINKETQKIEKIALFFWENNDNYAYLKKRFSSYEWHEEKINSKKTDTDAERVQVKIPKLGITFEYDDASPQRKIMWIFFEVPADL